MQLFRHRTHIFTTHMAHHHLTFLLPLTHFTGEMWNNRGNKLLSASPAAFVWQISLLCWLFCCFYFLEGYHPDIDKTIRKQHSTFLLKRTLSCEEDGDHKTHDNSDTDRADSEEEKKKSEGQPNCFVSHSDVIGPCRPIGHTAWQRLTKTINIVVVFFLFLSSSPSLTCLSARYHHP